MAQHIYRGSITMNYSSDDDDEEDPNQGVVLVTNNPILAQQGVQQTILVRETKGAAPFCARRGAVHNDMMLR